MEEAENVTAKPSHEDIETTPDALVFIVAIGSRRDARQAGPSPKSSAVRLVTPAMARNDAKSTSSRLRPTRVSPALRLCGSTIRKSGRNAAPPVSAP